MIGRLVFDCLLLLLVSVLVLLWSSSIWTMICAVQSRLSLLCEDLGLPLNLWSLTVLVGSGVMPLFFAAVVWGLWGVYRVVWLAVGDGADGFLGVGGAVGRD